MTNETIKIEGLKELEKTLREIAPMIKGNPLRKAVQAMTVPLLERAVQHANAIDDIETKTNIARAMDKKLIPISERDAATSKGDSLEIYEVGPRKKKKKGVLPAWYAHFVEFGTVKQRPQPFLRPAFEETKQVMIDEFTDKLSKVLETARKRLVGQGKL